MIEPSTSINKASVPKNLAVTHSASKISSFAYNRERQLLEAFPVRGSDGPGKRLVDVDWQVEEVAECFDCAPAPYKGTRFDRNNGEVVNEGVGLSAWGKLLEVAMIGKIYQEHGDDGKRAAFCKSVVGANALREG